jgi:hypothetical protein
LFPFKSVEVLEAAGMEMNALYQSRADANRLCNKLHLEDAEKKTRDRLIAN